MRTDGRLDLECVFNDLTAVLPFRKRTMFQKLVDYMQDVPEEKERINYVSNNPTRKEIIM